MMQNVGGEFIQENFLKYGYVVDLLFIPTKPCSNSRDLKTGNIVEWLWSNRQDHSVEFFSQLAS
jgi:hypothetical protein